MEATGTHVKAMDPAYGKGNVETHLEANAEELLSLIVHGDVDIEGNGYISRGGCGVLGGASERRGRRASKNGVGMEKFIPEFRTRGKARRSRERNISALGFSN